MECLLFLAWDQPLDDKFGTWDSLGLFLALAAHLIWMLMPGRLLLLRRLVGNG